MTLPFVLGLDSVKSKHEMMILPLTEKWISAEFDLPVFNFDNPKPFGIFLKVKHIQIELYI